MSMRGPSTAAALMAAAAVLLLMLPVSPAAPDDTTTYEQETRRAFAGWKAEHGKAYRDAREEECRYRVFKGNRRVVVMLNAAAAGDGETAAAYGLNRFGDLTNEEVRGCGYDGRGGECQATVAAGDDSVVVYGDEWMGKLSTRCEAAVAGGVADDYENIKKRIRSQVCRCIASELKHTESGGSAIPGDEAHMPI